MRLQEAKQLTATQPLTQDKGLKTAPYSRQFPAPMLLHCITEPLCPGQGSLASCQADARAGKEIHSSTGAEFQPPGLLIAPGQLTHSFLWFIDQPLVSLTNTS